MLTPEERWRMMEMIPGTFLCRRQSCLRKVFAKLCESRGDVVSPVVVGGDREREELIRAPNGDDGKRHKLDEDSVDSQAADQEFGFQILARL